MTMQVESSSTPLLRVELTHAPTLNFAMEQAGVPVITGLRISNDGVAAEDALELVTAIEPNLAAPQAHRVGRVRPGEPVDLGAIDLRLTAGRLRSVLEAERAELVWQLRRGNTILASGGGSIDVLAFNEWAGLRAPPALLATFVTPNDPVVASLLRRVRDRLRTTTGDGALSGYQTRSPERVRAMVRALYETLQSLGISYIGAPASYESSGQKIRLAEPVVRESLANCLDLTLLAASCLEQMGLSPLIVVQKGHAFPGVWLLDERFHECIVYDAARLRNAIALGHVAFFDSSTTVSDPPPPLDAAVRVAEDALKDDREFLCAIDVAVARRDRYRPLPLREDLLQRATTRDGGSEAARAILDEAAKLAAEAPPEAPPAAPGPARESALPGAPAVANRFRQWRDKLLDLSLRNKLLNFRPDAKGALRLDVPDIARLEDLLAADELFDVHPKPVDPRDERDSKMVRAHGGDDTRRAAVLNDLAKGILHAPLDESAMLKHAIHLDREARTALEEGGANVLYVAIGLLKWYETDTTETVRYAPLLLVPVSLEYVRTTRRVRLRHIQEESLPNWTLVEKMRADFAVDLSCLANIEPDDSGLDVPAMLRGVREAIQRMRRWEVIDEAHLGLFSFTKYLMWRDLVDNAEVLLENDVIRHIASKKTDGFAAKGEPVAPERLDDEVPPAQLPLVVDADSTQASAVVAALRGRSFVLQGPPGTGKSQTITNLIAAALAHGKTILFVSEKMAALEVVFRRLKGVGLGDFCLELHSHKSQKREVVQSLGTTLERAERVKRPRWDESSRELGDMRARLNAYVRTLHAPTPLGSSFHEASARLIALRDVPATRVGVPNVTALSREQLKNALAGAAAFGTLASQVEPVAANPFRDCATEGWSAQRDQEVRDLLARAIVALEEVDAATRELCASLETAYPLPVEAAFELAELTKAVSGGPVPAAWRDDERWRAFRDRVARWNELGEDERQRRGELARRWGESFYGVELADLEALFGKWATAFFLFAWIFLYGARRRLAPLASGGLPGNRQIALDLATARKVNELEAAHRTEDRALARELEGCCATNDAERVQGVVARGETLRVAARRAAMHKNRNIERAVALAEVTATDTERAAFAAKADRVLAATRAYRAASEAACNALALTPGVWPDDGERHLEETRGKLRRWSDEFAKYRPWCLYQRGRREIIDAGFAPLADAHFAGAVRGAQCESVLERGLLTAWTMAVRDGTPVLRDFDGKSHHTLVDDFRSADQSHVRHGRAHIVGLMEDRLPQSNAEVGAASEPGILKRELAKKTRHMPLRKLLQQIPNLLVRLKPCLLMSPLSVAQYLPARGRRFDIVVFDEASQICTHDAIGAIGRGDQVVVVGDSKQLPPTAFFQRTTTEEAAPDENDFTELESILDEALASNLPEQMLGWHYRSRHEALIEFSNVHYYDSKLNVFPAARGRVADLGVKFHHVQNGLYEAGKSRTNPREARALVDALVKQLETTKPTDRSFGIVTFSAAQQEHIDNLLNEARRDHPNIEAHFADDHPSFEKVFVKNLENVQGDERDEIFFSVAYGPDEHGKMLMNFGPLNRDGGERRLNVAVTRARKQLRIFSSITADKIDTNRTRAKGSAHLKSFLRFAAERSAGSVARSTELAGEFDSDFERDVFDVLRANGYTIDTQVGCGGYRIDLAVVHPQHPGVYAIGIECDGAAYHSGATARDRDRLRQEVLEDLGWRLHRIWSTDWIYDRAREIERLQQAIEAAVREGPLEVVEQPKALSAPELTESMRDDASTPQLGTVVAPSASAPASPVIPYRRAELRLVSSDPEAMYHPSRSGDVRALMLEVLTVEAPIHVDELARRVGSAFGAQRVTGRVRRMMIDVLRQIPGYSVVDDFIWPDAVDRSFYVHVRVGDGRDAETLPPEEIAAGARWVLSRSFSMPMANLVRETARVFGIQRMGAKVEARMRAGIDVLVQRGACGQEGDRAVWKGDSA